MDRDTISQYGWIMILVIVLSTLFATVTPFGAFVAGGFKSYYVAFTQTNNKAEEIMEAFPETPYDIAKKYDTKNYDSLSKAIGDVNIDDIGKNAIDNLAFEDAVAAVYENDKGETITILLKDTTETNEIVITKDQIISLGGHKLTFEGTPRATGFSTLPAGDETINVTFDCRLVNSYVVIKDPRACALYANVNANGVGANVVVRGGKWESYGTRMNAGTQAITFFIHNNSSLSLDGTTVEAYVDNPIDSSAYCVRINRRATGYINNCRMHADAKYGADALIRDYSASSSAVANAGTLLVKNCEMFATHSAITNNGILYLEGGKYESVGHGGLYASKSNGTLGINYLRDAQFTESKTYTGRYDLADDNPGSSWNHAGIYIGGNAQAEHIKVYMDNCTIFGTRAPINFRYNYSEGYEPETGKPDLWREYNNTAYISNSTINLDSEQGIMIRHILNTLYIGKGNNFTADNVGRANLHSYPERAFATDEVYARGEALDKIFALKEPPKMDQLPE